MFFCSCHEACASFPSVRSYASCRACAQTNKREKLRAERACKLAKEQDLRAPAAAPVDSARSLQSARDRSAALAPLGQESRQKPIRLPCIQPTRVQFRRCLIRAREAGFAVPRISRKAALASARRAEAELEEDLDAYVLQSAVAREQRARVCCAPQRAPATPFAQLSLFRSLVPQLAGSEKHARVLEKEEACRLAIVRLTAAQRATRRACSRGRLLLRNALMTNKCALMLEGTGLADSIAALVSQIQVRSAAHQGELAEPGSCDPTGAVRHYRARTSVLEGLLIPLVQGLQGRAAEVQKESGADLDELEVSGEDAGSEDRHDSEADSDCEDFALEDSRENIEDTSVSGSDDGAGSDGNADGDESEDSTGDRESRPRFSARGPTVCAGGCTEDCL